MNKKGLFGKGKQGFWKKTGLDFHAPSYFREKHTV